MAHEQFPWLHSLINIKRHECSKHPQAVKSKSNFFCVTCLGRTLGCKFCVKESHAGHRTLQLKLASYRECVEPCELQSLGVDLSEIKCDFKINNHPIVFLNNKKKKLSTEHGQDRGKKSSRRRKLISKDCSCQYCGKSMDGNFKFCSLGCKYPTPTLGAGATLEVGVGIGAGVAAATTLEDGAVTTLEVQGTPNNSLQGTSDEAGLSKVEGYDNSKNGGGVENIQNKKLGDMDLVKVQQESKKLRDRGGAGKPTSVGIAKEQQESKKLRGRGGAAKHTSVVTAKEQQESKKLRGRGGAGKPASVGIAKEQQESKKLRDRGGAGKPTNVGIAKEQQVSKGSLTPMLDERSVHVNVIEQSARFLEYGRFRKHRIFKKEAEQSPTIIDYGRFGKKKMSNIQAEKFPGPAVNVCDTSLRQISSTDVGSFKDNGIQDLHHLPLKKKIILEVSNIVAENSHVKKRKSERSNIQAANSHVKNRKTSEKSNIQAENSHVKTRRTSNKSNTAENFQGPDMNGCDASVLPRSSTLIPSCQDKTTQDLRLLHQRERRALEMSTIQSDEFPGADVNVFDTGMLRIPSPHVSSLKKRTIEDLRLLPLKKRKTLEEIVQKLPLKKRFSFEPGMDSVRHVDRRTLKTPFTYKRNNELTYAGKEGEVVKILERFRELHWQYTSSKEGSVLV